MAKANTYGRMDSFTMVNGSKTILMVMVRNQKTETHTKANSFGGTCRDMGVVSGKTDAYT